MAGLSQQEVIARIKPFGFTLLEPYTTARTPALVKCSCGAETRMVLHSILRGSKCKACAYKFTLAQVQEIFRSKGHVLLATEYVDNNTLMPYICNCGEYSEARLRSIQDGHACKICGLGKHTLATAQRRFADFNCELLATEYINNSTPMPYICECGQISKITLANLTSGQRCGFCAHKRRIDSARRFTFEYVANLFQQQGHELLTFTDLRTRLTFKCKCGRLDSIHATDLALHQERVCRFCQQEAAVSQHWRRTPEYRSWRQQVLFRDDYTCIVCGASVHEGHGLVLNAHHKFSPTSTDLMYDTDNGVTCCQICHVDYHVKYGYTNCTERDFELFKLDMQRDCRTVPRVRI